MTSSLFSQRTSHAMMATALVLVVAAETHRAQTAQPIDTRAVSEMRWRMIGPHRASRSKAVAGIAGQPHTFFMGVVNGGVWKTTDAGRIWTPIFDDQPTGSIGAIAVAPSQPYVIYVGTGEGQQRPDLATGDGIYKSIDGGRDLDASGAARQASRSPTSSSTRKTRTGCSSPLLGHPYGPNEERGIFRSLDGGKSFQKVLYKDENTGGSDVAFDPKNPQHRLRRALGGAAGSVGERRLGRAGERSVQIDRRRHHLEASDERTADVRARARAHRHHGLRRADPKRLFAVVDASRTRPGFIARTMPARVWARVNADPRVRGAAAATSPR